MQNSKFLLTPSQQKQRFKFNRLFDYYSKVVIDEIGNNGETIMELEYQLDEIKLFELKDSDIILKIETAAPELNKVAKSDIEIKLKNAYGYHDNGKHFLTHQYNIRTQDGFILLTPYLPQSANLLTDQPILYEAMYVRRFERHVTAARSYFVAIDLAENTIETYKTVYHFPNNVRPM